MKLDLGIAAYTPLHGSSYVKLPAKLEDKKAILNIQNDDQKCFLWSILAALHPVHWRDHAQRVQHYRSFEGELNVGGIEFPVKVSDITKFEKQNPALSINLFGYEEKELFPLYITKEKKEHHVNLLLISSNETKHYCLIRNLSRLLRSLTKYKCKKYFCEYCLHGFVWEDSLLEHEPHCSKNGPQKIKLPDEGHDVLYFKDVQKQLKVPFIIYADFESILVKCDEQQLDPSLSFTQKTQEHKPSGFCYTVVSEVEAYNTAPVVYRGENTVDKFLDHLLQEEKRIKEILEHVVPMSINNVEEQAFQRATHCHICGEVLDSDCVRDHCHLTGKYRGVAHSDCNLNYKFSNRIPVVIHNLRGYDTPNHGRFGKIERSTYHLYTQQLGKVHFVYCGEFGFH